jgi:serine protease Do
MKYVRILFIVALVAVAGVMLQSPSIAKAEGFGAWFKEKSDEIKKNFSNDNTPSVTVSPLPKEVAAPQGAPQSFADLAEMLLPSVVNISSTQKIEAPNPTQGFPGLQGTPFEGSPFEQLFKDFMNRNGLQPPLDGVPMPDGNGGDEFGGEDPFGGMAPASSLGSGFVINAEKGLIVTNNHVVKDADEVRVTLHDDTTLDAKILGTDEKTDLALIQVEPNPKLKAVSFGNSDLMRVGDWVLAIGNPFGLGGTVTTGIISARQRNINAGPYDDFLQTDASINRGNSGGPMFNLRGEVIGINTAIFSPSGGSVGIGFAIPSNLAKNVIDQLVSFGKTRRGWLGIRIQSVTPEIAETLGLPDAHGALVASITAGGPAEKAQLKPGDVIIEFNGKKLDASNHLPRLVAETKIGSTATLKIMRDGKMIDATIEVGELEKAEEQGKLTLNNGSDAPTTDKAGTDLKDLGFMLSDLSPLVRESFDIPSNTKGVVVTRVAPASEAGEKGLTEGDVIVEVNQAPVTSAAAAEKTIRDVQKSGKNSVLLLVDYQGQGDVRFVALRLKK